MQLIFAFLFFIIIFLIFGNTLGTSFLLTLFIFFAIIASCIFYVNHKYKKTQELEEEATKLLEEREKEKRKQQEQRELYLKQRQEAINKFNEAIDSLELADISIWDEKVKKKPISDLYDFKFKNITKSTNFENLKDFTVIDVETTGLKVSSCEIIEVSAIRFRDLEPVSAFTTLLKSKNPIPPEATAINNITNEMVADKPYFYQIANPLNDFIGNDSLVGHNLLFDLKFLYKNGYDFLSQKRSYYDTLELSRKTIKDIDNYKLTTICDYIGLYRDDSHRALSDSLATGYLFTLLAKHRTGEDICF